MIKASEKRIFSRATLLAAGIALLAPILATGCSAGMAPDGMTADQSKKAFEAKSPQDQIAFIEHSPASEAEKAKEIAAIKAKYNMK